MAVQPNATFVFQGYQATHVGIELTFNCLDPGPGQESLYTVLVTDAELTAVTTQAQLRTLIISKLKRYIRAENVASRLDQFIGQSVVI